MNHTESVVRALIYKGADAHLPSKSCTGIIDYILTSNTRLIPEL